MNGLDSVEVILFFILIVCYALTYFLMIYTNDKSKFMKQIIISETIIIDLTICLFLIT